MQITIDVEKVDGLFLKQELGTATIGDEALSFGICLPTGTPYVYMRGEYYTASEIYQKMLRAAYKQENHEEHPAPCDEHVAQPASTPERVAEIAAAYEASAEEPDEG